MEGIGSLHHVTPLRRAFTSPPSPSPSPSTERRKKKRRADQVEDLTNYVQFKDEHYDSNQELLTVPAGWLIKLLTFHVELITSSFLSISAPFLTLFWQSQAIPSLIARWGAAFLRRLPFGLLGAAYAVVVLLAAMLVSVVLGVGVVRMFMMEEPVVLQAPVHFEYTEPHPSAALVLKGVPGQRGGRALPLGHTMTVSLTLILPESEFNRQVGVFQVGAEAISSAGDVVAASSQPCMLIYRSLPVRVMRAMALGLPLLMGMCSESQTISMVVLRYKETRRRSETIRVRLKPRAGTTDLPQLYTAEVLIRSQLPWAKELAHKWKWTFYVWASLYMYITLLILLFCCCFKPFALPGLRNLRRAEGDEEEPWNGHGRGVAAGEGISDELAETLRRWRERSKKKAAAGALRLDQEVRPEVGENSTASSAVGVEGAGEVIDDCDFAASESSECIDRWPSGWCSSIGTD